MWEIAKELIGSKVVDILANFVGLGQAQNVKDAIKALNNSDWIDFTANVGQIVVQNTPLGKLLKGLEAGKNLYDLYKRVERVWDKIGAFGEAALNRIWNIARNIPGDLKFNPNYLKYVGDLDVPKLGWVANAPPMDAAWYVRSDFYRNKVFRANFPDIPQAQFDNMEIHHAMPQDVLSRYPDLGVSVNQVHSLENLRGIPKDAYHPDDPNQKLHPYITGQWTSWMNSNPNATMQQVLDKAKSFDDEFGKLFNPPIR